MADFTTAINYAGDLSRFDGQIRRHFRPFAAVSPVEKQKIGILQRKPPIYFQKVSSSSSSFSSPSDSEMWNYW